MPSSLQLKTFKTDAIPAPVFSVPILQEGRKALEAMNSVSNLGLSLQLADVLDMLKCCFGTAASVLIGVKRRCERSISARGYHFVVSTYLCVPAGDGPGL
jgi:hypothetical protein